MIINHNLSAINANRNFKNNTINMDYHMEKLSSGLRIVKARDDAAGLAVSEKMRAQIRGLQQASRNTQAGISFIQSTEGYLQETTQILQRVRELSVQAANGIYTLDDRMQIQVEVSQLIDEIDRVASHAEFNRLIMLTGRYASGTNGLTFHLGANMNQNETIYIAAMTAEALELAEGYNMSKKAKITMSTQESSNYAIGAVDEALKLVNSQRANLGAYQNRLELAMKGIDVAAENFQSAESVVRDADMAHQMVEYTKYQILTQSSATMMAQANMRSQLVLRILG